MPYIEQSRREEIESFVPQRDIYNCLITMDAVAGDLNYLITSMVDSYILANGLSYRTINDIVGALECAKMELYRRVASGYEDSKIKQNGEVYSKVALNEKES